jgi:hypothetical protein
LHYSIEKCFTKFVLLATSQDLQKKMEPSARMEEPGQKRLQSWHGIEEPTSRMNPKPQTLVLDDSKLLLFRNITSKYTWNFLASLHQCWPGGGLGLVHFIKWMTHQGKPEF